ncbi:MAG: zinc metalloprotease HtpX [Actinobacteria bacterium]|nr:zinc metalloprotease HtpX [Actinomycetota bacterium]
MDNRIKTTVLLGALAGLLVGLGALIAGTNGALIGLILAGVMNFAAYWFSDRIALKMSKAKPVSEAEAPDLYASVRSLCQVGNLPMPRLYLIPSDQPNAFATGRNPEHSAVAVTQGLMRFLSRDELEGVIAHELAHISNRDILISSVAATIAGAISYIGILARWTAIFGRDERNPIGYIGVILTSMLAGFAALIIQMAISRAREFHADATGARLSGRPESLASALGKIEQYAKQVPMPVNPSAAPMFIINPLRGRDVAKWFSTHPPTQERVQRLEAMIGRVG